MTGPREFGWRSVFTLESNAGRRVLIVIIVLCVTVPFFAYQRCKGSSLATVVLRVDGQCAGAVDIFAESSRDAAAVPREHRAQGLPWVSSEYTDVTPSVEFKLTASASGCKRLTCAVQVDGEVVVRRDAEPSSSSIDCNYTSGE